MEAPLGQAGGQQPDLDVDDAGQVVAREVVEHHDLVDAVEELGPELRADGVEDGVLGTA